MIFFLFRTVSNTEDDVDVTGFSDDEEEVDVQVKKQTNNKKQDNKESNKTAMASSADDTLIVDIEGDESSNLQKAVMMPSADDTLIVDIEGDESSNLQKAVMMPSADDTLISEIEGDESTFLTIGNKNRSPIALDQNDESAVDSSYQMDENLVLEGTRHKAMSPEFVSSMESKREDDQSTKEVSKPQGRSIQINEEGIKKTSGSQEDIVTLPSKRTKSNENEKKRGRKSNRTNRQAKNEVRGSEDMATISSIADQTVEGNSTVNHGKKKTARKTTMKSRMRKDRHSENGVEKNSEDEDDMATISSIADQTVEGNSTVNHGKKKTARKSTMKSRMRKDQHSENGVEENSEDEEDMATISSIADQTVEGNSTANHGKKKTARKSTMKSRMRKDRHSENGVEENSEDEEDMATISSIADRTVEGNSTVNHRKKKTARKSTMKSRTEKIVIVRMEWRRTQKMKRTWLQSHP